MLLPFLNSNKVMMTSMSKAVNFVGKMISAKLSKASKNIPDKVYDIDSLDNITQSQTSEILSNLLGIVHKSLSYGPKTELINSVMLSSFTGRSTSLQCMLGGYFRNIPVKRIMKLNKYGMVCSYDELKCLCTSTAKYSNDNAYHLNSLVQIIIDNFDLDIASPNGKAQTHSLGMIVTKNESGLSEENKVTTIPRIHHTQCNKPIDYQTNNQRYKGPQNPKMILLPSHVEKSDLTATNILHDQASLTDIGF